MDHKLRNLRDEFKQSIPTRFSERDKQAVFEKIHQPKQQTDGQLFPKTLTVFAFLAASLFIIFTFANNGLNILSSDKSGFDNLENKVIVSGIDNNEDAMGEPTISGYVVQVTDDNIIVVENNTQNAKSDEPMEWFPAILFDRAPSNVKVGDFVHVWARDTVDNSSYPGNASVGNLEVAEVEHREGAILSDARAIQLAIKHGQELGKLTQDVSPIRNVQFEKETNKWIITFVDLVYREDIEIEILDEGPKQGDEARSIEYETILPEKKHLTFDERDIYIGETVGHFTVRDIIEFEKEKVIYFDSVESISLTGDIIQSHNWLFQFGEHMTGLPSLPVEINDVGNPVQFKLNNEATIQAMYTMFSDNDLFKDYSIYVNGLSYVLSENRSEIILWLDDQGFDNQLYSTTIHVDNGIVETYEQYKESFDDSVLMNFEPYNFIQLYVHAATEKDDEILRHLFLGEPREEMYFLLNYLNMSNLFLIMQKEDQAMILFDEYDSKILTLEKNEQGIWKVSLPK